MQNLNEIKRERKHLEQDAQMMANRLNYLQQEDQRTWKKIQETKRKAQKFSEVKQDQELRLLRQYEAKAERERAISEKRSNYKTLRERQKQERVELKSAFFRSKQEEARALKDQKEMNLRRIQDELEARKDENFKKRAAVSRDKVVGKIKIDRFYENKNWVGKQSYLKKLEENEKIKMEKERELEGMEKLELELIRRLQNTQFIREHAVMELESMFKNGGMYYKDNRDSY